MPPGMATTIVEAAAVDTGGTAGMAGEVPAAGADREGAAGAVRAGAGVRDGALAHGGAT
jgi:hypothetical protein